jgi:hypothetical protein
MPSSAAIAGIARQLIAISIARHRAANFFILIFSHYL